MYISRIILNPFNAGARRDAARPYELHKTLMRAIEPASTGERLLYRIEPDSGHAGPTVLVQTRASPPDWSALQENGYLTRAEGPKEFKPRLHAAQQLRFHLTANPVMKHGRLRIPLIFDAHTDEGITTYWDWLHRQGERCGFRVISARDSTFRTATNRRKQDHYEKVAIPHFGVRFAGLLEVRDADRLVAAVQSGIGPAKAFGFGLLSIAPA